MLAAAVAGGFPAASAMAHACPSQHGPKLGGRNPIRWQAASRWRKHKGSGDDTQEEQPTPNIQPSAAIVSVMDGSKDESPSRPLFFFFAAARDPKKTCRERCQANTCPQGKKRSVFLNSEK